VRPYDAGSSSYRREHDIDNAERRLVFATMLKIALTTSHKMADNVGVTSICGLLERKLPEHTIVQRLMWYWCVAQLMHMLYKDLLEMNLVSWCHK
jgi:hypothetical protein